MLVTSYEQARFEDLWKAAQPLLKAAEVKQGREEGVYPPRDQEKGAKPLSCKLHVKRPRD